MNISKKQFHTKNNQQGFTLIELMVVVSIIALISTVALAALGDARAKARNTAKNSLVLEYVKALELYRSNNNGYYPQSDDYICFGYEDDENCFLGTSHTGSETIKTEMQNYLGGDFASRSPVPYLSHDLKGVRYTCPTSSCDQYTLVWVLESDISTCIDEARTGSIGGNSTCTYILE